MSDKYIYQQDGSIKKWIALPKMVSGTVPYESSEYKNWLSSMAEYEKQVSALPSILATLQGYKEGDVLVEGVDFEFQVGPHPDWSPTYNNPDDPPTEKFALPLKKEENNSEKPDYGDFITEKDWDDLQELRTKEKNERDAELKSLHEENERLKAAIDLIRLSVEKAKETIKAINQK